MGHGQPCDSTWGGGVSLQVCEDRVSLIWGMGNQLGGGGGGGLAARGSHWLKDSLT